MGYLMGSFKYKNSVMAGFNISRVFLSNQSRSKKYITIIVLIN